MRMVIKFAAYGVYVYCIRTFLYVLSMVIYLRYNLKIIICLKIRLFALYGRLCSLGIIIYGNTQNANTGDYTQFFIESRYHLYGFLCKTCVFLLAIAF